MKCAITHRYGLSSFCGPEIHIYSTQVTYQGCGHVRYIVKAWCTRYQQTHERCPPNVVAVLVALFEFNTVNVDVLLISSVEKLNLMRNAVGFLALEYIYDIYTSQAS